MSQCEGAAGPLGTTGPVHPSRHPGQTSGHAFCDSTCGTWEPERHSRCCSYNCTSSANVMKQLQMLKESHRGKARSWLSSRERTV